ncbi:MAG: hypothetical protein WC044_13165 [Crocinitomicaceae bacterium]
MNSLIKYSIVLIILQFSLNSCGLIVYKVYFKAKIIPKYTSKKKINKFFKKHAATQDNLVFLSDSSFVQKIEEPGWAFNSWRLYNSNGERLRRGSDSLACFGSDKTFLKNFSMENAIIDSSKNLSLNYFTNQKFYNPSLGSQTELDTVSEYDYTLILYWSKWRGRFSEDILDLEKVFVLNNPELRIRVIKVNMDFRDEMENTWVNKFDLWTKEVKRRKEKK